MKQVRRLYNQFQPENYDLTINPDKATMSFRGELVISGRKVGRPSMRITLHTKNLHIDEASIISVFKNRSEQRSIEVKRIVTHKSFDELRLHTDELLYPGVYKIKLKFHGNITKPMSGLYPCYFKKGSKQQVILATQFESHHAREVFPCIDEPEAKAIFNLSLTAPIGETVLANTPVFKTEKSDGQQLISFEPTPRMSTYLLAFVIGQLSYLEKQTKSGVAVRSYATQAQIAHTKFALDIAVKCLDLYNDYFGIEYPLKKCDLVALPDFASGAMENWGLITFREQALVVDNDNTSLTMKQYVANVVAHELTHQWFGNLVTMRWWNDLWLNESFASLMSYLAVDKLFPEWQVWSQFIVEEQEVALKLDSLEHTHPINVSIHHPDEIRTIFDNISYEKGASVLFMLMHYLGSENFRDGLRLYLKRNAYTNTESRDLWLAWEQVAGMPISGFMDAWTRQAGFPLVRAKISPLKVETSQRRFFINPKADPDNNLWPLPLFPNSEFKSYITDKQEDTIMVVSSKQPILINSGHKAFYRVIYDHAHLDTLIRQIEQGNVGELDRQGLLGDSFEAAKAGFQSSVDCLDLLKAFKKEDSVVVWDIISDNLTSIRAVMDDDELRVAMNPSIRELISGQYNRLGWQVNDNESHFDKLLRPIILGLACISEDPNAIKQARHLFYNRKKLSIHPDIRGVVYTTVARHGDRDEFDQLLTLHNHSTNSEESVTLAAALTNFRQPELIKEALKLITSKEVRLQDVAYWISYSFANRYAKDLTWQWLQDHWPWLENNLSGDLSFYMLPRYAAKAYSDDNVLPQFKSFFEQHLNEAFVRPLNQAVETISWQSAWRQRDHRAVRQYFGLS